ncbi:MAG: O-acetyl-ADP-ribose deacetylase [Gemmataceae bacterium]
MEKAATWGGCEVFLERGDITELEVDAIVNAANSGLRGGGGVDGAIHRKGGPAIAEECRRIIADLGRVPTGQAVITGAGRLRARYVIHAVGPVYGTDPQHEAELLASAYRHSLVLAREHGLHSVAFPCISTGAYGYPADQACQIAVRTVREELEKHRAPKRVVFCTYTESDHKLYRRALGLEQE